MEEGRRTTASARTRSPARPDGRLHHRLMLTVAVALGLVVMVVVVALWHHGPQVNGTAAPSGSSPSAGSPVPAHPSTTTSPVAPSPSTTSSLPPVTTTTNAPLEAQFSSYLGSRQGDVTASVLNLANGQTFRYNPGVGQATASIVKVDIMATLMAQSTASGQPIPAADQQLLHSMIEVSDNESATALWNAVGGPGGITTYNRLVGMGSTVPSSCLQCPGFIYPGWGLTTTTPSDQIALLQSLLFPNARISATDRAEALSLMENITPSEDWGVSSGVPSGVTVALKNGWVPLQNGLWQVNSIGYINGDGRDYLIAVMDNGNPDEQYGIDTIQALSSMVWAAEGPSTTS